MWMNRYKGGNRVLLVTKELELEFPEHISVQGRYGNSIFSASHHIRHIRACSRLVTYVIVAAAAHLD